LFDNNTEEIYAVWILYIIYEQPFNTLLTGYSLMFESIFRHKQVVMAAIAITALVGYVVPLNQFAVAQEEDAFTTLEDFIAQEGTATASGEQNPSITAPNTQTNAIVTGPATATQTNTATSTSTAASRASGGDAEGGDGGDGGCGDCKDGKKSWSDGGTNDGDGGNAIGGDAFSAAQSGSSVSVNSNTNTADSSADGNTQSNSNTQSFDLDLDQTTTANVDQLAAQISDNYFNVDLDGLLGDD
jgi:hypothetical protein